MNMVYRRKKVERTIFRKLGFGQAFYDVQANNQFYYSWRKVGRRHYDDGPETVNGTMMGNSVPNVATKAVIKVHPVWNEYKPGS